MSQKQDIYWVHLIRATAVFCVVLLHSGAQLLQLDLPYASSQWWVGNIIDSSMRMCVPLLFMITGFLLLGKTEPIMVFFSKRLTKIAIPLFVWTVVYVCWLVFVEADNPTPISPYSKEITDGLLSVFPFSLVALFVSPAYFHLWFMYALIGLYFCIPLLRALIQGTDKTVLWYFVGLWGIATYFFPIIEAAGFYNLVDLSMVTGNIGFLVLGYLLGNASISRRQFLWMWPLFIVSVAVTAAGTWWLSSEGSLDQYFYGNSPNVIAMTVAGFIILRYLGENSRTLASARSKRVVTQLSASAFGIYLIHALFLYAFHKGMFGFTLDSVQGEALIFVPLTAVLVYLSSFAVIYIVRKIPYIRAAAP